MMRTAGTIHIPRSAWLAGVVAVLLVPGCREEEPSFEILALEGRIEAIDQTSDREGQISVLYYNEKRKEDVIGTGLITPETEIMINGALATLADLREGDRVRGNVRVEKKGGERRQIALKIYVDRPKPGGRSGS